jgi:hypothetical protein
VQCQIAGWTNRDHDACSDCLVGWCLDWSAYPAATHPPDWSPTEGPEEFTHWMRLCWPPASGARINYDRGIKSRVIRGLPVAGR